ncbi:MAG TPA: YtxH domain-containing protein [Bacillales bacterium]|nr:YtxH domain-containing protein [Bacillales bacterium]
MEKDNKLFKGILYGALAGAAISLLDRETRENTVSRVKDCGRTVWHYSKHPSELIDGVSDKISGARQKIEGVTDDITFIVEKVNDIKRSSDKLLLSNEIEDGRELDEI